MRATKPARIAAPYREFGLELGGRLKELRWRRERLAVLCDVSGSTVDNWLAGKKAPSGPHMMLILREVFGWEPPFDTRMWFNGRTQASQA